MIYLMQEGIIYLTFYKKIYPYFGMNFFIKTILLSIPLTATVLWGADDEGEKNPDAYNLQQSGTKLRPYDVIQSNDPESTLLLLVPSVSNWSLLQELDDIGQTLLHQACSQGKINVIEAVLNLFGENVLLELLQVPNRSGRTPFNSAALSNKNVVFAWLLQCCKQHVVFKQNLKKVVQSLENRRLESANRRLKLVNPETQAAIMALLEFLNQDPDEGCKLNQYSSSNDDYNDDDDAGSSGSNGNKASNASVFNLYFVNTQAGSSNQSQGSSSSNKTASSLMDFVKLNPPGVEDAGIRSVMGY